MKKLFWTESPRDAMQGLKKFIPTEVKAAYINKLLKVGFDVLDAASFVSPKAVPQMSDTAELIDMLDTSDTKTQLMILVANLKGAEKAATYDKVDRISYPFSISDTFLRKNINSNIQESEAIIDKLQELCDKHNKELALYISMAFGNPYGDKWDIYILMKWIKKLKEKGVKNIALTDVMGLASDTLIASVYGTLKVHYPDDNFGFHLHTNPMEWFPKVHAAYKNGCRNFETVMKGIGGCPMTGYELVANLSTESLLGFFDDYDVEVPIDRKAFKESAILAEQTYNKGI